MEKFPSSRFWSRLKKWSRGRVVMFLFYFLFLGFFIFCAFSTSDFSVFLLGFFFSFPVGFVIVLSYLSEKSVKKVIEHLSREEAMTVSLELEDDATIVKGNLFLTENYIIGIGIRGHGLIATLDIIKYSDIIWVYTFLKRIRSRYNCEDHFLVVVYTRNCKKYVLAHSLFEKKALSMLNFILSKNPNALSGYTPQNIKFVSEKAERMIE